MKRQARTPQPRKKPYVAPRLTTYGKFRDIVQGTGGAKNEPGVGDRSRA